MPRPATSRRVYAPAKGLEPRDIGTTGKRAKSRVTAKNAASSRTIGGVTFEFRKKTTHPLSGRKGGWS